MRNNILLFALMLVTLYPVKGQGPVNVLPALDMLSKYPTVRDFTMSPEENEAYFTLQSPLEEISVIAFVQKEGNLWSGPKIADFSGSYKDMEPFLSPDGRRLYFVSNRPLNDSINEPKDFDIWYVERKGPASKWSAPKNMGSPINTEHNEFYPALATNHNIYFTSDAPNSKGKDDIFFSEWQNDQYTAPISLGSAINTEGYEYNSYIAPDESFLIFGGYNREDGLGSGDLYISFQNEDRTWRTSKNMGEGINSKYMDYCPFVDMASQTLYFTSKRSSLKSGGFKSIEEFDAAVGGYENGYSRIYKVPIKNIIDKE